MSIQLIQKYYTELDKVIRYGGTRNELSLNKPFQDLLETKRGTRIPFYEDFRQWTEWGKRLMELHLGYESVEAMKIIKEMP